MENQPNIHIALVDDDDLIVQLLHAYFKDHARIRVLLKANDGSELLEQLANAETLPDIILLDLKMKKMDGIETTTLLRETYPDLKIIIMSSHYKPSFMGYMLKTGVNAFIPKEISPDYLEQVIGAVAENGYYFSEEHIENMRQQISSKAPKPKLSSQELLTEREAEILRLICQQYTTQEISDKLFITKRTVEGHKSNLILKTGVKNTAGLVIYAIQNNLIGPDELIIVS